MRVLITNKSLGFDEDAIIEDAVEYSPIWGGYVGHLSNGVRIAIATEDGAIIVEDVDEGILG